MGGDENVDSAGPGDGAQSPDSEEPEEPDDQAEPPADQEPSPQTPADSGFVSESADGGDDSDTSGPRNPSQSERGPEGSRGIGGPHQAKSDSDTEAPTTHHTSTEPDPKAGFGSALAWFRQSDSQWVAFLRETLVSVLLVLAVGFLLFAISGVWPPLVAVESNSMDPHLQKGDLVLVMAEDRLSPEFAAGDTGIVTAETGAAKDYNRFGGPGDVIVYQPYGSETATPIIHRAHLYVEEGENWYDRADPDVIQADSCAELGACPAPSDGFITKGDNPTTNNYYDQERGISSVVEPEWVRGTATVRIPWVGWIRLAVSELELPGMFGTTGALGGV